MSLPRTVDCGLCLLRPWNQADRPALLRYANNRRVWRNLRDLFPHPYDDAAADVWLGMTAGEEPPEGIWAIELDGEAIGCLAVERQGDVARGSAEIGYWLGQPFWGRGIASAAVHHASEVALGQPDLWRLFAPVFSWNPASMRILEKNGFQREAVLKRAGIKDGEVFDSIIYARTRDPGFPYTPAP
jgi:ribosomal-protein-alanine N-acetyltransferase